MKLEMLAKLFSTFNQCPSLPCVATDNEKQFHLLNIDWDIVFSHVIDGTTRFSFLKRSSKKRDIAIVIK